MTFTAVGTSPGLCGAWRCPRGRGSGVPWESPRSGSTTLSFNELSDFVEITHPFHPFRGQRHPRITSKKWEQRDLLSLAVVGRGTLCVPREWTDRADPVAYSSHGPLLLSYERLVELAEFLTHLRKKTGE
jgi:hypothetical protein